MYVITITIKKNRFFNMGNESRNTKNTLKMKTDAYLLISIIIDTDIQILKRIIKRISINNNCSFKQAFYYFIYVTKYC